MTVQDFDLKKSQVAPQAKSFFSINELIVESLRANLLGGGGSHMNLLHLASCFGRRGDRVESPPIAWEGREANCKVQMC